MASWKQVITTADDATYQNEDITLGQLHKGIGAGTGNGAGKVLKLNSSNNAIEWATDTDTVYTLPTASASALGGIKVGAGLTINGSSVLSAVDSNTTYTIEAVDDAPAAKIRLNPSTGANVDVQLVEGDLTYAVNMGGDEITATITPERVQDIVGAMLTGNTETNIAVTYQDSDGTIDFASTDTVYTLPKAEANVLGGIKVGAGLSVDAAGTLSNASTNTDVSVSVSNLETTLGNINSNYTIGNHGSVNGTISGDLTVTGDLVVSGATTTINTATLEVEDKLVKLANVASPTITTGHQAGIQVEVSATEAEFPEVKWDNSGKLSGWTASDYKSGGNSDYAISVMSFGTSAPSGAPDAGAGLFFSDTTNAKLYIYV